jgi:hypothetical protein
MVGDKFWVSLGFPVHAKIGDIPDFLCVAIHEPVESPRSLLQQTKREHLSRGLLPLVGNCDLVGVPSVGPLLRILIDGVEEEMMKKPKVLRSVNEQSTGDLELVKEVHPLPSNSVGPVDPQTLNPNVVD